MDADEFDEFYRASAARVVRYAYAMCGDRSTAQELAQEAFMRGWRDWRRLREYDNAEAWVRLVVTRLCTDRWRRLGVHRQATEGLRPLDVVPPPTEDSVVLTAALRRLPAVQRRVLVLHYLLDMSLPDIAAETGVALGTLKSRLARGRSALAAELGFPSNGQEHANAR